VANGMDENDGPRRSVLVRTQLNRGSKDAFICISLMNDSMVTGIQVIRQVDPEKRHG
jgi:hypothetical protein